MLKSVVQKDMMETCQFRVETSVVLLGLGFHRSCKLTFSCFWKGDLLSLLSTMFSPLKNAEVSVFVAMQQAGKDLGENESFYWWWFKAIRLTFEFES